jgi:tetratricopeptide (TPR) repeat protein
MSLSAAASALAPNPKAEKLCEQGHVLLSKKRNKEARDCFAKAVELTQCNDKVYTFALAQSELACKNIPAAIKAFQLSHAADPQWFAPKEALRMLGAPLKEKQAGEKKDNKK